MYAVITHLSTQPHAQDVCVCRARLATDPSHRYPLAIKQMACTSAKAHKIVKHESDVMRAMHNAGLACIPRPYDLHWLQDQGKAFLVME